MLDRLTEQAIAAGAATALAYQAPPAAPGALAWLNRLWSVLVLKLLKIRLSL